MIKNCKIGDLDITDLVVDIQGLKTAGVENESRDLENLFITIQHYNKITLDLFKKLMFEMQFEYYLFELNHCDNFGDFTYKFIGEIKVKDLTLLNVENHINNPNEKMRYLLSFEFKKMLLTNKE